MNTVKGIYMQREQGWDTLHEKLTENYIDTWGQQSASDLYRGGNVSDKSACGRKRRLPVPIILETRASSKMGEVKE
jgi:hypothetical protein